MEPALRFNGEKNPAEVAILESKEAPIVKSIGVMKTKEGYISFILTSQGGEVLKVEPGQPNLKGVAIGEAKINFEDTFLNEF